MKAAVKWPVLMAFVFGLSLAGQAAGQATSAPAPAKPAMNADELVEKHLAAIGGREALKKLESRVATGTISMSVQGNTISGPAEMTAKAPNKSRTYFKLDLSGMGAGEVVVDQRCDGKSAWVSNSMQGDRDITGSQLQALLNSVFPSPLLDYKAAGATLEVVGQQTVAGRPAHVLQFTPKSGAPAKVHVDAETFLAVRIVSALDVPEMGGAVEQRTEFDDYRAVDGVKVPFTLRITTGMQEFAITLTKVEHNKPIDDAIFAKPAAK